MRWTCFSKKVLGLACCLERKGPIILLCPEAFVHIIYTYVHMNTKRLTKWGIPPAHRNPNYPNGRELRTKILGSRPFFGSWLRTPLEDRCPFIMKCESSYCCSQGCCIVSNRKEAQGCQSRPWMAASILGVLQRRGALHGAGRKCIFLVVRELGEALNAKHTVNFQQYPHFYMHEILLG